MKEKSWPGIIVIGFLVYWFVLRTEENPANRAAVGHVLAPIGDLVIEAKFRWAATVGHGLKLAGTMLEFDYLFSDGGKGRTTHEVRKDVLDKLKSGDTVIVRDEDGIERRCVLVEVGGRDARARVERTAVVRFELDHVETRTMPQPAAFRLAARLGEIPGTPYWIRPLGGNRCELKYGPLHFAQEAVFPNSGEAQAFAKELRNAGFAVTMDSGDSGGFGRPPG